MKPNSCPHEFDQIAKKLIPDFLSSLKNSRQSPWVFSDFQDNSKAAAQKKLGLGSEDFPGCYLFFDPHEPSDQGRYVGISRGVVARVWDHYRGKTHYQTNLSYKIAKKKPGARIQKYARECKNLIYQREFQDAQQIVRSWSVATVQIDDAVTKYLFEVAASMHFKTGELNCFRTH